MQVVAIWDAEGDQPGKVTRATKQAIHVLYDDEDEANLGHDDIWRLVCTCCQSVKQTLFASPWTDIRVHCKPAASGMHQTSDMHQAPWLKSCVCTGLLVHSVA